MFDLGVHYLESWIREISLHDSFWIEAKGTTGTAMLWNLVNSNKGRLSAASWKSRMETCFAFPSCLQTWRRSHQPGLGGVGAARKRHGAKLNTGATLGTTTAEVRTILDEVDYLPSIGSVIQKLDAAARSVLAEQWSGSALLRLGNKTQDRLALLFPERASLSWRGLAARNDQGGDDGGNGARFP